MVYRYALVIIININITYKKISLVYHTIVERVP